MKRGAIYLGLLAVVAVVGFLLSALDDEGSARGRRTAGADREASGSSGGAAGAAEDAGAGAGAKGGAVVRDDDPNRIDGPELVVRGLVVRYGRPVAGAAVMLQRATPTDPRLARVWNRQRMRTDTAPPIAETTSDEDGRFELRAPRRSRVTVTARAEGTGPASVRLYVPLEKNPKEVKLELPDGYALRGIVVDAKGKPLEGAEVASSSGGFETFPQVAIAVTGADGRFEFGGLGRGYHRVTAKMEGYPEYERNVNVPEATEIEMRLFRGASLHGVVKDDKGRIVAGARIELTFSSRGEVLAGSAEGVSGPDGTYSMPLVPASPIRAATIDHDEWGDRTSSRGEIRLPLEPLEAGKATEWNIELARGATVRGVIVERGSGTPVPNATLTFLRQTENGRGFAEMRYTETGQNGRFEAQHVLEGTYTIRVAAERHARAVQTWVQPNQQTTSDFFVDGVNDPPDVRIEVDGAGRIEGQMVGEPPATWATTNVQLMDNTGWARIDPTGFFVFESVAAGDNKQLRCWSPQCQSDPFSVVAGEIATVELKADAKAQFTGTVVGANGDPVRGAYVRACPASQMQQQMRNILQQGGWGSSRTDGDGHFSIYIPEWQAKQSASGDWVIGAVSYEYPLQVQEGIRLPAEGSSTEIRITLQAGGGIAGRVEFQGRGPLPGIHVSVSPKYASPEEQKTDARQSRYCYTDLAGAFHFTGIGSGEWNVTAFHADGKAKTVTASAGDREVRIVIEATLALEGVVIDENGDPLSQAQVGAVVGSDGKKEDIRWATTDTSGRFRIAHLDPGDYPIEVTPQRANNNRGYYPGQSVVAGFKKTRTKPYPAGTEGIVIEVEPGNRIKGRVIGPGGSGVGGAAVMALPMTEGLKLQPTAFSNGRGDFTLKGVEQGEYEIVVLAGGYLIESTRASVGQTDAEIRLRKGAKIEGVVLAPNGSPATSTWVQLVAKDPEVQKKLQDWQRRGNVAWNNVGGWQKMATSTKADGSFEIAGLFPGKYSVNISTQLGVAPVLELDTDSGKQTIRLEGGVTIKGRVVTESGDPPTVSNGQIWVSAQRPDGQWIASGQPDSEGNFELQNVPRTELTLQVWAGNEYQPARETVQGGDQSIRIVLKPREAQPQPK